IRNNVIYNSATHGIGFGGDDLYSNSNQEIYNNTIYNNGDAMWVDSVDGIIIKNNLIFGNSSAGDEAFSSNISSDYNLWAPNKPSWSEGPHSIIQTSTSDIAVCPAGGDFRLTSGSPAIGRGVPLNATRFVTDFAGTPRTQGPAWDIGAHEFTLSVSVINAEV